MEPARGESCPSGQRRGPTAPGEERVIPGSETLPDLQLQQTVDENGDHPGRYRPARRGNVNPTGGLLISSGLWSYRVVRVVPRDNVKVPPHPGRIGSHPRIRVRAGSPAVQGVQQYTAEPSKWFPSATLGAHGMSGCCAAAWCCVDGS